jgi:hypothetical protein
MTSQQPTIAAIDRRDMTAQAGQMSVFATREAMAKPWRLAAEAALINLNYPADQRERNHRYYLSKAEAIERGEA